MRVKGKPSRNESGFFYFFSLFFSSGEPRDEPSRHGGAVTHIPDPVVSPEPEPPSVIPQHKLITAAV